MKVEYQFLGLPQDQWQFINTFADWFSAIGTIAAVWVSLRLARKASQPRAKLTCAIVLTIGNGAPKQEFLNFSLVNTGDRPIRVTQIGWTVGLFKKRYAAQLLGMTPLSSPLPMDLEHAQTGNWFVETQRMPDGETWAEHFGKKFIGPYKRWDLMTLRAHAYTSTGHVFTATPSKDVLAELRKACAPE